MGLIREGNFEYTRLDNKTKAIVCQRTSEIKELMRLTAENIINIGQKLIEVKDRLGHGSFQSWLKSEFEWSEQTARQFMQVYRWSETIENKNFVFSQLATSALYLLAAPSTPTEARKEVLGLVDGNEKISYTCVKNIVDRYKQQSSEDYEAIDTVEVLVEEKIKPADKAFNRFFRLKTSKLGCIVRLYRVEELETITDLNIGSTVKIKVGRWRGQTATVIEILQEPQLPMSDNEPTRSLSHTRLPQRQIKIRIIDDMDLSDREKLQRVSQNLLISYGSTCLAIEGNHTILNAFTTKIKFNSAFAESIFRQASEPPAPESI